MLLTASFLMVRGFQHSVVQGTGFAKDHLLMARFDPRLVQYNAAQTQQFYSGWPNACERRRASRARRSPRTRRSGSTVSTASPSCPTDSRCRAIARTFTSSMDTIDEGYF